MPHEGAPQKGADKSMSEENEALVRRYVEEVYDQHYPGGEIGP
jgi:hypothetical protein